MNLEADDAFQTSSRRLDSVTKGGGHQVAMCSLDSSDDRLAGEVYYTRG